MNQPAINHPSNPAQLLEARITSRQAHIGIIGIGYVGLPLAVATAKAGFPVTGFDVNARRVEQIYAGQSYIGGVSDAELSAKVKAGKLNATTDFGKLAECDVIVICVPTPLTKNREPDLTYIEKSAQAIAASLRPGQLIVLESTTYPGTTRDIIIPVLSTTGLKNGIDYFVAYSPEREDPGNKDFNITVVPKVVGADDETARTCVMAFYSSFVPKVVPVSSLDTAEAVKLTENIFRAINIALVNELKVIYEALNVDVWEVIEAAKTKPFGYMPFYPGPGLGGHCIPIDPFYLTWRARSVEMPTKFIELAGEINTRMPYYVVDKLALSLDEYAGRGLHGAKILVLGMAYKKNVPDIRESPSLRILTLLSRRGAEIMFYDPHVDEIDDYHDHPEWHGMKGEKLTADLLQSVDAALLVTDHESFDYDFIAAHAKLVIDTRNAFAKVNNPKARIIKA